MNDEVAGEWLNENTNTGMVSHKVVKKPPAVGNSYNTALFHSGIK
ncbi:alanine aminotransferase [Haemophilus influenzae PittAA]|nr:alanine aminotransferase [Haemophilus influenzae PittAA]